MLYLSSHGATSQGSGGGATGPALSVKDAPFNAVGDGVTDDRVAIQTAIAAAVTQGRPLYFPAGVYRVSREPTGFHSLALQNVSNVQLFGEPGRSWIKQINNVAGTAALCYLLRISGCENVVIDGLGFDGNWGNAVVYVKAETSGFPSFVNLAALPSNELLFEGDATNFPASGSLKVVTATGPQTLTYTGKAAGKFTGVSAGTGYAQAGDSVGLIDKAQKSGLVAAGSNGAELSTATSIAVESTAGFPNSVTADGIVQVLTSSGFRSFRYSSKDATNFNGVSNASGSGTLATGNPVQYVDGAGNQAGAPMQLDPKNHTVFCYGSDGFVATPNRNITFSNCRFRDAYGDHLWIGAWSYNVKVLNCIGDISARNGITLSNFAEGVQIAGSEFDNIFTSAVDSEPVDGPVRDITIDGCKLGMWWNPQHDTAGNITLSLQGGVVGRQAHWNYLRNIRVTNTTVKGGTLVSDASDVSINNCRLTCDFDTTTTAPVCLLMYCDGIVVADNYVYSSLTPSNRQFNFGAINVSAYRMSANTAAQPANVVIRNNKVHARNAVKGIYVEAVGGYTGVSGTAISYLPPSGLANGEIEVAGTPWASQLDYFIGHQVVMGGKVASVVGNDANTLFIAPLFNSAASGSAWTDHFGRPITAPAAGAFRLLATGGRVDIDSNKIDCRDSDGKGSGGYGVDVDTSTTWDPGYNDSRVVVRSNDVRGANGRAYNINVQTQVGAPFRELQLIGNHAWDDQTVPTCTHNIYFTGATNITDRVIHGNMQEGAIVPMTGLDGHWRQADSYPGSWAGFVDPNGLVFAPPTATYHYLSAGAVYVKESADTFSTGWNPLKGAIRAGIRAVGTPVAGTGSLNLSGAMPASVIGDVELLFLSTSFIGAAGSDATLSTAAGFVKKASVTSNSGGNAIVTRCAVWWRRRKPGDVVPVVADSGDHNEAVVVAIRDAVGYGDPFDFTPVGSANNGTSQAVTITGGTTTVDGGLFLALLAWFSSGATNSVGAWANADPDLTEGTEALDAGVVAGTERVGLALYTGRTETAAAVGNTTATIEAENYAVWGALAFAIRPAQTLGRASGLITCTAQANYTDGEVMLTLGDGISPPKEYEADVNGTGVTAGRVQVNISGDTTAAQVAARLRTAILTAHPSIGVTDNGDGTLTLLHQWPGAGGNVAMTEGVANAGHTISGLSGGQG